MSRPIRVAVIGAGPSGFYAAQALTRQLDSVVVDLFERLPAPHGLVRYGVAPDHPKLKSVTRVYDQIAGYDNIRFIGNVELGSDVSLDELRVRYHGVIVACGTAIGKKQDIPGHELAGSVSAAEFVGWYNGHPDHQHHQFDLTGQHVAVIGNGNVALDVARILARSVDELQTTDITSNALNSLRASQVTDVHIIGRRGPVNASFGKKELREFGHLNGVQSIVDPTDLALNDELQQTLDNDSERQAIYGALADFAKSNSPPAADHGFSRRCHFRFYQSAVSLEGGNQVERLILKSNLPDRPDPAPIGCRLVVFSIGYSGQTIDTLETDRSTGAIANDGGRVIVQGEAQPGMYVSGWIKRGPTGLIGTNRADSVETVESLVQDIDQLPEPTDNTDIVQVLASRGHQSVDFNGWLNIHHAEQQLGALRQAPAEKFTSIEQMLEHANRQRPSDRAQ